jgi:hypothetical protein
MTEYNLNILSFHYNIVDDTENLSLEKRLDMIEEQLKIFKEQSKPVKIVMCSEFYLCTTKNNRISVSSIKDKEYINERLINISSKYKDIVFLPGTYYLLNLEKGCYDNILPILYNGRLVKEHIKFKSEDHILANAYDDTLIKMTDGSNMFSDTIDTCTQAKKGNESDLVLSNIIPELDEYNYIYGICSDVSCGRSIVIKNDKKTVQLYVAYHFGGTIIIRDPPQPVICVDGTENNIKIDFFGTVNDDTDKIMDISFLKINYLKKFTVKPRKNPMSFNLFTIKRQYNEYIENPVITQDIISKFTNSIKSLNNAISIFKNEYNDEIESNSNDPSFLRVLSQYNEANDLLTNITTIIDSNSKQKYLKYKMKYMKLKNLIK